MTTRNHKLYWQAAKDSHTSIESTQDIIGNIKRHTSNQLANCICLMRVNTITSIKSKPTDHHDGNAWLTNSWCFYHQQRHGQLVVKASSRALLASWGHNQQMQHYASNSIIVDTDTVLVVTTTLQQGTAVHTAAKQPSHLFKAAYTWSQQHQPVCC